MDLHSREGMLCQDCHSSLDVHGKEALSGANLAQVESERQDCHATPKSYLWKLPIGYGDEFGEEPPPEPRAVATKLEAWMERGTVYPVVDGHFVIRQGKPAAKCRLRGLPRGGSYRKGGKASSSSR